jgi:hypothetical protein
VRISYNNRLIVDSGGGDDCDGTWTLTTTHNNQIELRREKERGRLEAVVALVKGLVDRTMHHLTIGGAVRPMTTGYYCGRGR